MILVDAQFERLLLDGVVSLFFLLRFFTTICVRYLGSIGTEEALAGA